MKETADMRSVSDILLDMDDRTRMVALALPAVIAIVLVLAGFYACSHGSQQAVVADESQQSEEEHAAEGESSSGKEDDRSKQAAGSNGSEESNEQAADTSNEALENGYKSETVEIDSATKNDAVDMKRAQTLQIGEDTISSGINVQIAPGDTDEAIREALGSSSNAISATITGEAKNGNYRQLAVASDDGTLLCLEMPAGTNGPITAKKVTTDEFRRLNLGTVIGHDDEATSTTETEANGNGQQQ